jgi:hypothetical protein
MDEDDERRCEGDIYCKECTVSCGRLCGNHAPKDQAEKFGWEYDDGVAEWTCPGCLEGSDA